MSKYSDIGDDEIRVVGSGRPKGHRQRRWWLWAIAAAIVIGVVAALTLIRPQQPETSNNNEAVSPTEETMTSDIWHNNIAADMAPCVVVTDTMVDSMQLRIFTPYNAVPELHVGQLDEQDSTIVFAAMAADLRRDNGKIVGAYVCAGEPLSWGLSKRGYCAIVEDRVAIGMAENTSLFEQATEKGGYFFRQYPAVDKGQMVANNPENASFRRALCLRDDKVCVVTSTDRVLMNDFSETLVDLGVSEAIFLVGGNVSGWYRDSQGKTVELGRDLRDKENINYIVFRMYE